MLDFLKHFLSGVIEVECSFFSIHRYCVQIVRFGSFKLINKSADVTLDLINVDKRLPICIVSGDSNVLGPSSKLLFVSTLSFLWCCSKPSHKMIKDAPSHLNESLLDVKFLGLALSLFEHRSLTIHLAPLHKTSICLT
ncbi:unnamed protein product [Moneuplotes crassus]|uniref:Uncharacterized protein n=1 Tax=Euplotes crassus TaxID=5936 RepID=A0AAD1Y0S7_EUPCR|nr:unnamed protein product [Moneuplotes crassus]